MKKMPGDWDFVFLLLLGVMLFGAIFIGTVAWQSGFSAGQQRMHPVDTGEILLHDVPRRSRDAD